MAMVAAIALASLGLLAGPTIENVKNGETLRYSLTLLRGHATGDHVEVGGIKFPAANGRYVAVAELKPGQNKIEVNDAAGSATVEITFSKPTTPFVIKPIWVVAKNGSGKYYTTMPQRTQNVGGTIDTAMKVLQCFVAETMNDEGYGRKTFSLPLKSDGSVDFDTVSVDKTDDEMRAMDGNQIWSYVYGQLKSKYPEDRMRWVAFIASTDYDAATQKNRAHLALGGGALACFGSGSFDFWPRTLAELPAALMDTTPVDQANRFDDSAFRKTAWGNMATTYGATLHELGHALGLPHTANPLGIMSRGFDHINRMFCTVEPPAFGKTAPTECTASNTATWDPPFAARLNFSKFLQPDRQTFRTRPGPSVKIDGDAVTLRAPLGIRVITAEADNRPAVWRQFLRPDPPTELTWSLKFLRERIKPDPSFRITVVDDEGNQTSETVKAEAASPRSEGH